MKQDAKYIHMCAIYGFIMTHPTDILSHIWQPNEAKTGVHSLLSSVFPPPTPEGNS